MNKLSTVGLLAVALGACQRPSAESDSAHHALARGQIVRCDLTYDAQNQHPRPRWIVRLAYPLQVKGLNDQEYSLVKVFNLSDTTVFRVGTKLVFTFETVPQARQTPWLTNYERAAHAFAAGFTPNPELLLDNVQLR